MKNYTDFTIEELVLDAYFQQWASDELSLEDTFWKEFLKQHPDQSEKLMIAREIIKTLKIHSNDISEKEMMNEVNTIHQKALKYSSTLKPLYNRTWFRLAASIVVLSGIGWLMMPQKQKLSEPLISIPSKQTKVEDELIHLVNDGENVTKYTLLDNTTVLLKRKSSLSYPKQFAANKREVSLKGEAFFEVTKDATRPFLIHTAQIVTKVLGTSFRIRAYEKDANISVDVKTGKVSVAVEENQNQGITLLPNQSTVFDKKDAKFFKYSANKPIKPNDFIVTAFDFKHTHFSNVVEQLQNAYNIKIVYDEELMKNCFITGNIPNQSLTQVLKEVCHHTHAECEIFDGKVVFKGKGC